MASGARAEAAGVKAPLATKGSGHGLLRIAGPEKRVDQRHRRVQSASRYCAVVEKAVEQGSLQGLDLETCRAVTLAQADAARRFAASLKSWRASPPGRDAAADVIKSEVVLPHAGGT